MKYYLTKQTLSEDIRVRLFTLCRLFGIVEYGDI